MRQVRSGIFVDPMERQSPMAPRLIAIRPFTLTGTFSSSEEEDVAARLIFFSQVEKKWVGVSQERLFQMLREEEVEERCYQVARSWYNEAVAQCERARKWYTFFGQCTRGFSAFFLLWPELPAEPCRRTRSSVYKPGDELASQAAMKQALECLVEKGMIHVVRCCQDGEEHVVYFPSPELVEHILQSQMARIMKADLASHATH